MEAIFLHPSQLWRGRRRRSRRSLYYLKNHLPYTNRREMRTGRQVAPMLFTVGENQTQSLIQHGEWGKSHSWRSNSVSRQKWVKKSPQIKGDIWSNFPTLCCRFFSFTLFPASGERKKRNFEDCWLLWLMFFSRRLEGDNAGKMAF